MGLLVVKFGGTSVGSADAIRQAAAITAGLTADHGRVVCVVSAMSGVTDQLLRGVRSATGGDAVTSQQIASVLLDRHRSAALECGMITSDGMVEVERLAGEFVALCQSVAVLREATPRVIDAVASLGERMSVHLVAGALKAIGADAVPVDAMGVVVTDARFGDAAPIPEETRARARARLLPILASGTIPVVTGYIGATADGAITTLGRGGSDYSAAIIGAALDADEVWIYTDVDGVMTADPRLASGARVIPVLSYSEMAELAYFGAKVLHPRTIRPAIEKGIRLRIRNTFKPEHPGTLVVTEPQPATGTVKAVTVVGNLSLITVEGRGMVGVPGIAARTFGAVARVGANVLMISQASSEQSICFVVPEPSAEPVVKALEDGLALELHRRDIDRVWSQNKIAIVSAVGAGMRGTPGVASRIFGALGQSHINIIAIAQGSSECSVSMVVAETDAHAAVRQIHDLTAGLWTPGS
ncbi:MAG: aspartate kinase [Acidobacteria bacterium]|nr:aspartate kinase [Acidobacteriota bacterium]